MTEAGSHRIPMEWNHTERDYPQDKCVHQLFEEQVERTPESVALVFEGQSLTYREFNTRANQLAHRLRSLGVGPDVLVGICAERSLEMVIGLLGILKAGGAYVPIDPEYPRARIAFMIEDAGTSILVTQNRLIARLPHIPARILVIDEHWQEIATHSEANLISETSSTDLAYMIYTSGSTGQPKGALNTHRGICNRLLWMQDQYQLDSTDVVLQKTPFSFDVSVWEFFWPLLTGARLVVAKPGGHRDAAYLIQFIQDHEVTTLHFVPPMLRVFLNEARVDECRTLRNVFCSGEVLAYDLQEKFFTLLGAQLHNLYGPTETAVDVTHWTCRRDNRSGVVPIGRPVANTQCYILDEHLQPVAIEDPGELHIGGVQIGRGYHNRPELTAERFIPDLFRPEQGTRLYKTGDLARYLPDGNIEFLGRIDQQVKVRGFRVELGEIEAVLRGHPDLAACAVVAHNLEGEGKALLAFVVGLAQADISARSLRQWLEQKLPEYMIPRFCMLPAIPLTPNGKVDRRALEMLDTEPLASGADCAPPRSDLESTLVEIWQTVLHRDRVGIRDNFIDLGGHSLLAMVICAQISRLLNLDVPLRWMFENPTIEGLAQQMGSLTKQPQDTQTISRPVPHPIERDYPRDKCIHHLFEKQVELTPDAVAVVYEGESLTYRELNARANRLGHHLHSLGVGPDIPVGLCLERSPEMIVGVLGILKAGGAYVPLDPSYPKDRLAYVTENTGNSLLVTNAALASCLPDGIARTIWLDDLPAKLGDDNLTLSASPRDLAYILYTSGSTGQPKGVAMEHGPLVNLIWWQLNESSPALRTLQFASLNFDVSFQEMFSTWLSGGTLTLVDPQTRRDPIALWEFIETQKLERLFLPTIMLQQLAEASFRSQQTDPSLREIITAGEQLRITPAIRKFFAARPGLSLHNHYGPTESHVVTAWRLPSPPETWPEFPPIGNPISNAVIRILDAHMNPVPRGARGEIYIGGKALARGYWNQPERTLERFARDSFSEDAEARLYRTGDIACYLPDGSLEFIGRTDHQVKIRGFRVELGDIETVLSAHPDISAGVVVTQDDGLGEKYLTSFVVAKNGSSLAPEDLRSWVGLKLPDYMIPRFCVLPELPQTPNGKVDRKALEKLGVESVAGGDYIAPRNDLESKLVDIWQTVLHRDRVGIRDNFFDLGGHSLLAMPMCAQISLRLNLDVPLRWVFENPTIEDLAKQMGTLTKQSQFTQPIEKPDRKQTQPMSFAQQRMWLLQQMQPDLATYNEPIAYRLSGSVDAARARRALHAIIQRHEVLRTALVVDGDTFGQQVASLEEMPFPWEEMDIQSVPPSEQKGVLAERLLAEVRRPFDLNQAPLWRAVWFKLAETEQVVAITFHHSIVDEWSMRLFLQEWERLYSADGRLELAGLPELPVQYGDYAAHQKQRLTGELLDQQRHYWKKQLQALPPPLELPCQRARPLRLTGRGTVHDFRLTGPVVTRLRELARAEGTSVFTVMLAAFQVWLHRYTGQADVIVGTPIANRERLETQSLIGFFLNTLPIRSRMRGSLSFPEVLRQAHTSMLDAVSNADLPFEQIVELAVRERNVAHHPLYQVMFVLLEESLPPLRFGQASCERLPVETQTSKNDLTLSIEAVGDAWNCRFEYATDLFSTEIVTRMADHFAELLRSITEHPDKPISLLRLMPEAESHRILVEWNQTERNYPRDKSIHELFDEQARLHPDAIALEMGGERITYGNLNQRSNDVVRHLRGRGVKPGAVVGLSIERSFERVAGLLGILKVGAIYWAVEENLPEERLRSLVDDAQPALILCGRNTAEMFGNMASISLMEEVLTATLKQADRIPFSSRPEDPAYVSYTSGSTGQPKGVVVPHRGVVRLVKGADYVSLTSEETLLHMSPLSFDASTFELWGALLNGGRVVLMPPGQFSLAEIGNVIREHHITTLWLTAGLFHLMVEERLDDLRGLRQLLAGGDVLSHAHVVKAHHALPECRLINGYGPTENTTFTCCYTVGNDCESRPIVPIGRPVTNTRVYILDENLQPVPVGVAGELYAGGDGVALGYLNQPELTAERFIPDTSSLQTGAQLYRTGDRARWLPDGNIEFLGRLDHQVKIRGFRVELGEIESALRSFPAVREAVVVQRKGLTSDPSLIGYVVGVEDSPLASDEIRRHLRRLLPEYMVPSAIIPLANLPLSTNGKLDRHRLPVPEEASGKVSTESVLPKDLLELQLIRIWERLFQRTGIGRKDNFFELGGHSLLAAKLAAELEKLLGCNLSIAALFQSSTIESLAQRLTDEHWAPPWSSLVPLKPVGSGPPLYLIHGVGGTVFGYLDLVQLLALDQPVYGVQAVGLDGKTPRHTTIESMAACYVQEILSFQPSGPYYLGGYSLGGLIAFEVSQQLHRLGHRVAVMALMDSGPTSRIPRVFYGLEMASYLPSRVVFHFRRWLGMARSDRIRYLRGRLMAFGNLMTMNSSRKRTLKVPDREAGQPPKEFRQPDYFHGVSLAYRLSRYPGSIDAFVSDESNLGLRCYWRYLARGGVRFNRVPGRHLQVFSADFLPVIAKSLSTVIKRAQERERQL